MQDHSELFNLQDLLTPHTPVPADEAPRAAVTNDQKLGAASFSSRGLQMLLGETLLELGNAAKAVEVLGKARAIQEREQGADHPHTLFTLSSLVHAASTLRRPFRFRTVRAVAFRRPCG